MPVRLDCAGRMKKINLLWLLICIIFNLLIWSWGSGLLQELTGQVKPAQQPVRALEEINADAIRLIKGVAPKELPVTDAILQESATSSAK